MRRNVSTFADRDRRIRGDTNRYSSLRSLQLIERKQPEPSYYEMKKALKFGRTSSLSGPTISATSDTPSPTMAPTNSRKKRNPRETPSPTASTKEPTNSPYPTHSPSMRPSHMPSETPSSRPSPVPSEQPSLEPTLEPTQSPTPEPTSWDSGYAFKLRLYWSPDYFWQETYDESWWCMECTQCDEYSLGDGPKSGCKAPGSSGSSCKPGNMIWIRKCKDKRRDYRFNIIKNQGSGDQIRVHDSNMCLSTVDNLYLEVQTCHSSKSNQLWKPIEDTNKFELRPYSQRDWSPRKAVCLSQMHHPKDKELVGLHRCRIALGHETLYWAEYHQ
eukprot:scaffold2334_cov118-Cylindrotheca_fusiformis.AAC.26